MKGVLLLASILLAASELALKAQGTAFMYQGHLNQGGTAANGQYDMLFTVYDVPNGPANVVGGPLTNTAVSVSNGTFSTVLDFGPGVFNGPSRWLEISVRTNGASNFVTLTNRQSILATPYAITSANAYNVLGTLAASNLPPGLAAIVQTNAGGGLNLTNAGNVFAGNGGGLTNLNLANAVGVLPENSIPTNINQSSIVVVPQATANILAKTPALGFNSWFGYGNNVTEAGMTNQILTASTNGMLAAGYKYFCIDQGWTQMYPDNWSNNIAYTNGSVVWYTGSIFVSTVGSNLDNAPSGYSQEWTYASSSYFRTNGIPIISTNFPHGMTWLANFAHTNHALLGLYTPGTYSYHGGIGSLDYEAQDGFTYASWGIDYVKIDGYRKTTELLVPAMMQTRPVFSTVTLGDADTLNGEFDPWVVGETSAHRGSLLGSLGPDMGPGNWVIFLQHAAYVNKYNAFCGKGHWADPDALNVYDSHFVKCEMGVFCTLTTDILWDDCPPSSFWQSLFYITNQEALAIDQDPGGYVGFIVSSNASGLGWVIAKPLTGPGSGKSAVCLFNSSTNSSQTITVNWSDIGLPPGPAFVRDAFQQANVGYFTNSYTVTLSNQDCQLLTIDANAGPFLKTGTNYVSDLGYLAGWTNFGLGSWPLDANGFLFPPQLDAKAGGGPLTLAGKTYRKGLGVAFTSHLQYALGGLASRFHSDVGIDQYYSYGPSAANFIVSVDGVQLWQSGTMTPNQVATCDLSVAGGNVLTLDCITEETGGNVELNCAGDWANAYVTCDPTLASLQSADGGVLTNLNASALQGVISTNNLPVPLAYLANGFAGLQNNTNGPTPAQIGKNGAVFWVSNGIVYCSISKDGTTISSVKQIAP